MTFISRRDNAHDIIVETIERFAEPEQLDPSYIAAEIICQLEHGGYPITCLENGSVEVQMAIDAATPAETLIKALERWISKPASEAARLAVAAEICEIEFQAMKNFKHKEHQRKCERSSQQ